MVIPGIIPEGDRVIPCPGTGDAGVGGAAIAPPGAPPGEGAGCWAKEGMLGFSELQRKNRIMALVQFFRKLLFFLGTIHLHKNGH
jgi:hypothetical protein